MNYSKLHAVGISRVTGETSGDCSGGKAIMTGVSLPHCIVIIIILVRSSNSGVRPVEGACVHKECKIPCRGVVNSF